MGLIVPQYGTGRDIPYPIKTTCPAETQGNYLIAVDIQLVKAILRTLIQFVERDGVMLLLGVNENLFPWLRADCAKKWQYFIPEFVTNKLLRKRPSATLITLRKRPRWPLQVYCVRIGAETNLSGRDRKFLRHFLERPIVHSHALFCNYFVAGRSVWNAFPCGSPRLFHVGQRAQPLRIPRRVTIEDLINGILLVFA